MKSWLPGILVSEVDKRMPTGVVAQLNSSISAGLLHGWLSKSSKRSKIRK